MALLLNQLSLYQIIVLLLKVVPYSFKVVHCSNNIDNYFDNNTTLVQQKIKSKNFFISSTFLISKAHPQFKTMYMKTGKKMLFILYDFFIQINMHYSNKLER